MPFPRTGGALEWTCAGPFEVTVLAWDDSVPILVDSQPSEAWGTGEVAASYADVLPSVGGLHIEVHTAVEVDRPAASAVVETLRAVGAAGGRPDLESSFSAAEPYATACSESLCDTEGGTESVGLSSAGQQRDGSLGSASLWPCFVAALDSCSFGHTDHPFRQCCETSYRGESALQVSFFPSSALRLPSAACLPH